MTPFPVYSPFIQHLTAPPPRPPCTPLPAWLPSSPCYPRLALGADWDPRTAGAGEQVAADLSLERQLQAFSNKAKGDQVPLQVGTLRATLPPCVVPCSRYVLATHP